MDNKTELKLKLLNLIKNNPNGFTANKKGYLKKLNSGYAVSMTNNKHKSINKLIDTAIQLSKNHKNYYFGGWFDSVNKEFYLDLSLIIDNKNKALNIARAYKQLAIFDFKKLDSINLSS